MVVSIEVLAREEGCSSGCLFCPFRTFRTSDCTIYKTGLGRIRGNVSGRRREKEAGSVGER
jgi:hypothetical protein